MMKNLLLVAAAGIVLGGTFAAGQEKSADPSVTPVRFPEATQQSAYAAANLEIVGTIDSGETSRAIEYSNKPEYRALVFEAKGNDKVEVAVTGLNGKAFVALADPSLNPIASGTGRLSATLPNRGPNNEAFYILFKSTDNQPARLVVHLTKISAPVQAAEALHFSDDATR